MKTDNKFTPGPWLAYNSKGNNGVILKQWHVSASATKEICIIHPTLNEMHNARLIAAAPEMLEALKEILEEFETYTKQHSLLVKKAENVIKKATDNDSNT